MLVNIKRKGTRTNHQSGQALLIILLVLAVALTLVLSSTTRSISDISVTEVEEDSSRAFSAAEAGVEEALLQLPAGNSGTYTYGGGLTADVEALPAINASRDFRYPEKLSRGEEATFWLIEHTNDNDEKFTCTGNCLTSNSIQNICWGDSTHTYSTPDEWPAFQITIYYDDTSAAGSAYDDGTGTPYWLQAGHLGDFSNVRTVTKGFDANGARTTLNGFNSASTGCNLGGGLSYKFRTGNLSFSGDLGVPSGCPGTTGCLVMAKIRMLYNNNPEPLFFRVPSGKKLPPQGRNINSTGSFQQLQRKVQVFESFSEPLEMFTGAIFSKDDLVK